MSEGLPAVLMRGGTSKGVFVHASDLPPHGPDRDALLLRIMGSPDPMQLDGLGGARSSTSKVVVVAPSAEPRVDVDYWFAQIGIENATVSWAGNCGNLTSAVGPFAIDEGLVEAAGPETTVVLRNRNTGVLVEATVPVVDGRAATTGDCFVPGVPGSGAPIATHYLAPSGGTLGATFPTGAPVDVVSTPDGRFHVTIVDITHPYAFVDAADLGIDLIWPVADLDADDALLWRLEALRGACARTLGLVRDAADAARRTPTVPRLVLVGPPVDGDDDSAGVDIRTVSVSMGRIHHALPMTAAMALAGAVLAHPDTVPARLAKLNGTVLRVRHAKGVSEVVVRAHGVPPDVVIDSVGVVRTARRLMSGTVYVPPAGPAEVGSSPLATDLEIL